MHLLILGKTSSGKSTLARQLIKVMKERYGVLSMVLDPFEDGAWTKEAGAHYVTSCQDSFLKRAKAWRKMFLVIDEASTTIGTHNPEMMWCGTQGRHYGHMCCFITQRGATLNLTVREQCSRKYVFQVGPRDVKYLSDELGPMAEQCGELEKGEFVYFPNFGEPQRRRIFKNESTK